jgi:excisionase family DNA binding protein
MLATETMSTAQAAEYLKVSPRTVQRLVARGELIPLAKLPGRTGSYVFDRAVVMAYLTHSTGELETWRVLATLPRLDQDPSHEIAHRKLTGSAGKRSVPKHTGT